MIDFREDFLREVASVAVAFEPNYSYGPDLDSYARELANWRRTASYPGMVQDVYILHHGPAHSQLLKIQSPGEEPERVDWPAALAQLRDMAITSLPTFRLLLPPPARKHSRGRSTYTWRACAGSWSLMPNSPR